MIDGRAQKEKDLLRRAIRGESSAFGLLYDQYHPKIYRFVLLKVGNREEAEDLTHQIFLSAWQHLENFRDVGASFSSWIYRIARNRIIDYYRTRKNLLQLEMISEDLPVIQQVSHETATDQKIKIEKVYRAISSLPKDQQDVILMRFVEELSLSEIAGAMEKNQGTVRVLQFRALRNLKKHIEFHED